MIKILIRVALVFAFASASIACSATQKNMSGAFATCMQADLGAQVTLPTIAGDLLDVVSLIIARNLPSLEADLGAVAAIVGPAALKCAIAAATDALLAALLAAQQAAGSGSGSGSGSAAPTPAPSTSQPVTDGIARARAYAATLK